MNPVYFEGAKEIGKPENMTDEQCFSVWAQYGVDSNGFPYFLVAWKPSYEDLQALNRGEPIYIKSLGERLVPMAVFTMNEDGGDNDAS